MNLLSFAPSCFVAIFVTSGKSNSLDVMVGAIFVHLSSSYETLLCSAVDGFAGWRSG
jgi:hypothetical protein